MKYVHKPSLREVAETNDAAALTGLVTVMDTYLDQLVNAAARKALMAARASILAAVKELSP